MEAVVDEETTGYLSSVERECYAFRATNPCSTQDDLSSKLGTDSAHLAVCVKPVRRVQSSIYLGAI